MVPGGLINLNTSHVNVNLSRLVNKGLKILI